MEKLILCVDDDEDVRESLAAILETQGYKTIRAANGLEGLAQFKIHENKLWGILTDAKMPEMDGLDFAVKVRETGAQIPIILVTAYLAKTPGEKGSDSVTVKQYHDIGINGHIEKPFEFDDLLAAVKLTFDPYAEKHFGATEQP